MAATLTEAPTGVNSKYTPLAGVPSRSHLGAGMGRWVAVLLAAGFIVSLLVVGSGVLTRKDGTQQGGVVGLLH